MERFVKRHESRIKGIVSGFDRMIFKGTFRSICRCDRMEIWLHFRGVLLKDFKQFAERVSSRIREHAKSFAEKHGRPYLHVSSPNDSKEDIAREVLQKDNVREGLICVLGCLEPCMTFSVRPEEQSGRRLLKVKYERRQCLHIYFYYLDREFGLMHVRLQTWLPFTIQVCINAWEYLAHKLERANISFEQRDNCFVHIDDIARAQELIDSLIERKWLGFLNHLARDINPWFNSKNPLGLPPYYWTIRECEFSTDVIFKNEAALSAIYPALIDHAIRDFHAKDVLRFLGRRPNVRFSGELKSDLKIRPEGTRIKHWLEENSIKMYDKQGRVLRVETTMNNPKRWNVWRRATRKGKRCMAWIPMRKSLADIRRRAHVSRAANARYLDALSVVGESLPARKLLDPITKRVSFRDRPYRPLHPIDPQDAELLSAISHGEFLIQGFRNRDLLQLLFPEVSTEQSIKGNLVSRLSRMIRILRAHQLVFKVSGTHLYRLTKKGHNIAAAVSKLRQINILEIAA
jgi:hypothetical protein